jgi:hypothetical protein
MKDIIAWLNDALSTKGIVSNMSHYKASNREICATDGRLLACHPWPYDGAFMVPGAEFEKVLNRLPGQPKLTLNKDSVTLSSGRFRGTLEVLPLSDWDTAWAIGDAVEWQPIPKGLPGLLKVLRGFISDNAVQQWSLCIALEDGWAYATNNVAIAGAPCKGLEGTKALLPIWAIDFLMGRLEGLESWVWNPNYCAFRWKNGAWMRAQLIVGQFPEKAAQLIRDSHNEQPTQEITKEFRAAFERVAELAEDTVALYADRIESKFGKAVVEDGLECEVPANSEFSLWGAKFLLPALQVAQYWSPGAWPGAAPFKGPVVSGYVIGRRA